MLRHLPFYLALASSATAVTVFLTTIITSVGEQRAAYTVGWSTVVTAVAVIAVFMSLGASLALTYPRGDDHV